MTRPDLDAIRARYLGEDTLAPPGAVLDVETLLAYIDMLEHMLSEERENVDTLRARIADLENRTTHTVGETEWAHRIAVAEQRFVDEYDARKAAEREIAELKARIVTLEAMR